MITAYFLRPTITRFADLSPAQGLGALLSYCVLRCSVQTEASGLSPTPLFEFCQISEDS